jgi:hypothetical protein
LYVLPAAAHKSQVPDLLNRRVDAWQSRYPGVRVAAVGDEFQILIPNAYRTSHEAHFAEVTAQFLKYVETKNTLPVWEIPHLLSKYYVTTQGVGRARGDLV